MASDSLLPKPKRHLPKWPFWIGDILLVCVGLVLFFQQGKGPLAPLAMGIIVFAIVAGAVIACAPYAIEYWATTVKGGGGGDWGEVRNKVIKLEFRLAEIELNNGAVPESARLAHSRYAQDEDDLGVGEVIKQPKQAVEEEVKPKQNAFSFGGPKGAALVGKASRGDEAEPEPKRESEPEPEDHHDEYDHATPDEALPTSLDDIGPAEKREPTHLRKALDQARKETGSKAVARLIRNGKG